MPGLLFLPSLKEKPKGGNYPRPRLGLKLMIIQGFETAKASTLRLYGDEKTISEVGTLFKVCANMGFC